ncbi:MAG: GNAT family N-acetyltransferase, partial [Bdellovibrionales bacterium]|nr:GNAT family N-acetyltransferase [Bdellovibrionales bacterium]
WDQGPKSIEELTKEKFKIILKNQSDRRSKDIFYDLGVFLNDGTLVGVVSIMEVARGISQTAFLGYRIFNPYWGQGYAKDAVQMIIDIGFKDIKLHRIEAGIEPGNKRSIALAKSLKMRKEGLKKRAIFLREMWVDLLMYTLTTEDLGYKFDKKIPKHQPRG